MPWYITTVEILKVNLAIPELSMWPRVVLQATAFMTFLLRLCVCLERDLYLCMPNVNFIALLHGSGYVTVCNIVQHNLMHAFKTEIKAWRYNKKQPLYANQITTVKIQNTSKLGTLHVTMYCFISYCMHCISFALCMFGERDIFMYVTPLQCIIALLPLCNFLHWYCAAKSDALSYACMKNCNKNNLYAKLKLIPCPTELLVWY